MASEARPFKGKLMVRDDLSDRLIHLTRGTGPVEANHRVEALGNLLSILNGSVLKGGNGFIKGKYKCVCFSEAPVSKLPTIMANAPSHNFKYQPYGVMVSKHWFFGQGGRPVIYGSSDEFDRLPEEMKHRHVNLHYGKPYNVDFTWEREWRLKSEEVSLDPSTVTVILPDWDARDVFVSTFKDKWHYLVLSDLGVPVQAL
jgi:hypothetical protein